MDSNDIENPSEVLLTLLAGFNELMRDSYISGFRDGQEFERKTFENRENNLASDREPDTTGEENLNEAKVLSEVEKILGEYL